METRVVHNPEEHRYEIWADDELAGVAEYHPYKGARAFIHTEVEPRFEGHGLGSTLVAGALDQVRSSGEPVLPFCPFVRGYIRKHCEYVDLVPADDRASFGV
ncbi:MAG TPA: GNAT family N-acetyltransferase [Jiangellaceae bacterium]